MTKSSINRNNLLTARALAARSLKDVSVASGVNLWTLSDFEQGLEGSLGEHSQAIERAMAGFGIRFEPDGSVVEETSPAPPRPQAGDPFRWIEAQDLANWGASRDGQERLPELVGRLILATVGPAADLRFPAGDSVLFAGWDGICRIATGRGKVPDGVSVWEIGTQRTRIREKADDDYEKRSKGPTTVDRKNTTYVFVTPQRWPKKEAWRQKKIAEGIWKEISVIDGDDLVHWLDLCPGVSRWLSVHVGKRRNDLRAIGQVFEEWSLATNPALSADLLLGDRDEQATLVRRWLKDAPALLTMQAESSEEATAFLRAVIDPLPVLHRLFWETRLLVAESSEAARGCIGLSAKIAIVLTDVDPGLAASLVKDGHHVFVAQGSDTGGSPGSPRLARPWKFTIRRALERMGLDQQRAQVSAAGCGRSLTVLRRLMPTSPGKKPSWSMAPVSPSLVAAMLAGAWEGSYPVDREVMERLSGRKYADFEADLTAFAGFDGPLRRSGSAWKLASLRDTWFLLADQLTSRHLDLLVENFLKVFSADDPDFDAPPESRWIVPTEPPKRASKLLRRGLAETLIALAVFPDRASEVADAKYRSQKAVRKLLENADARRWWSLSNDFCLLAEASPEALLDALERALHADSRPIMPLFRSDEGFIHKVEYLAELMWAIEILAWNPDYLGRAALILARLAELDPGGSFSNRPDATLRTIFLPRSPRTFASMIERMEVVDAVKSKYPSVGWKLLVALAPRVHPIIEPSAFPTWRDFSAEAAARGSSLSENLREIGARMVAEVGTDVGRWSDVFGHWNGFDAEWRKNAERALSGVIDTASADERVALREMLRQIIGKHEQFPEADWTLKADALAPLKALYERLEPSDPIVRHAWLFGAPNYKFRSDRDWNELQKEAEEARHAAAEQVLETASPEAVIAMAKTVKNPRLLGDAVAAASVPDETKDDILDRALPDSGMEEFIRGMLSTLRLSRGESWLLERFEKGAQRNEDPDLLVRLAIQLESGRANWDAIERAGADVATRYWKRMNAFAPGSKDDPDYVIEKLLAANNGRSAMTWIAANPTMPVPTSVIASVLRHPSTKDVAGNQDGGMFQHEAAELFKRLDGDSTFPRPEIASLEWMYYVVLEHGQRPAKCLDEAIAADPSFFVHLLALCYPAEGEPQQTEFSESERNMASQAYRVLKGWSVVPGIKADGEIDAEALSSWVAEALRLAGEKWRSGVAESKIGAILSRAPDKDGVPWPPEAVRRIIEHVGSKELENGFFVAEQNKHGSTVRRTTEGGGIERDIASRYRSLAKAAGIANVRTRALLNMLAESYEHEAGEEDRSAERRDW